MGKKNKNKNKVNNNPIPPKKTPAVPEQKPELEKPTLRVLTKNEITTTEEGEAILTESLEAVDAYVKAKQEEADNYLSTKKEEADNYYDTKKQEADIYYDGKKTDADKLEGKAAESIQNAVDAAVKEKQKEMKKEVDDAKELAKSILSDAEKEASEKTDELKRREKELDECGEKYTKDLASLEAKKVSYKQEVLSSVQDEIGSISQDKENLEKRIAELEKENKKYKSDIKALEEDKAFCEEELTNNSVKKSDILSYTIQIENLERNNATLTKMYKELQEASEGLRAQILLYGDSPAKALEENAEMRKKVQALQDDLANCPGAEELARLRETNERYEQLTNRLEMIEAEKNALETENVELRVTKDEIETCRRFIKILELQKDELRREIDRNIELYNNSTEKVFASLSLIDNEPCNEYPSMMGKITLEQLCKRFRGYLANRPENPLYYDEKMIRTFIAGFASSRLMILEGMSGTGKSSLPSAFQDFIGATTLKVEVQSSWKDRNDLLGFYNDFKKQYKETKFLKALYKATHDPNNIYVIVLDEMNLSRIEYYFDDLLSVLEGTEEEWQLELISDYASITQNKDAWPKLIHNGKLQICDNTWFVGTANKDDSTFIITDKVYDRATVLNFDKRGEKENVDAATPIKMSSSDFQTLLHNASRFKSDSDRSRFYSMIKDLDNLVKDMFEITFGNRIQMQLETFVPVYIACGGSVDEAVDIMFSRKVLRKLDGVYDESTKENLELLKEDIHGKYQMPITEKAIDKMMDKI